MVASSPYKDNYQKRYLGDLICNIENSQERTCSLPQGAEKGRWDLIITPMNRGNVVLSGHTTPADTGIPLNKGASLLNQQPSKNRSMVSRGAQNSQAGDFKHQKHQSLVGNTPLHQTRKGKNIPGVAAAGIAAQSNNN